MGRGDLIRAIWDVHRAPRAGLESMERLGRARLAETIAFARSRSALYRKRYAGLPDPIDDLRRLPPVTKEEMVEEFEGWVTVPIRRADVERHLADTANIGAPFVDGSIVCRTSGSTGIAGFVVQDTPTLRVAAALWAGRAYGQWLPARKWLPTLRGKVRSASILATQDHYGTTAWYRRMSRGRERPNRRLFPIDLPRDELVAALNEFQPESLGGYSHGLELLAHEQAEGRLRIRPWLVIGGGENFSSGGRERIEAAFDCKVHESYSATECIAMAFACERNWLHVNIDWCILEPVSRSYEPTPPGEASETVLVTNLSSRIQPFVRYDLGDSILVRPDPCPCGSPLPAMKVQGRREDLLFFEAGDGSSVPIAGGSILVILEKIAGIQRHQTIQTTPRSLRVRLETLAGQEPEPVWSEVEAKLRHHFVREGLANVRVERDRVPPGNDPVSGKYHWVWSEVRRPAG